MLIPSTRSGKALVKLAFAVERAFAPVPAVVLVEGAVTTVDPPVRWASVIPEPSVRTKTYDLPRSVVVMFELSVEDSICALFVTPGPQALARTVSDGFQ